MNKLELLYLKESYKIDALELSMMVESFGNPSDFVEKAKAFIKELIRKIKEFFDRTLKQITQKLGFEIRSRAIIAKIKARGFISGKKVSSLTNKLDFMQRMDVPHALSNSTIVVKHIPLHRVGVDFTEYLRLLAISAKITLDNKFKKLTPEKVAAHKQAILNSEAKMIANLDNAFKQTYQISLYDAEEFIKESTKESEEMIKNIRKMVNEVEPKLKIQEELDNPDLVELYILLTKVINNYSQKAALLAIQTMDENLKNIEAQIDIAKSLI